MTESVKAQVLSAQKERDAEPQDIWARRMQQFQGRGVSYLSAPTNSVSYTASSLVR